MKLLAGTILKTLLVDAFKGTPNIWEFGDSSHHSLLLENTVCISVLDREKKKSWPKKV